MTAPATKLCATDGLYQEPLSLQAKGARKREDREVSRGSKRKSYELRRARSAGW